MLNLDADSCDAWVNDSIQFDGSSLCRLAHQLPGVCITYGQKVQILEEDVYQILCEAWPESAP